jgi:hypothetical protein
LTYDMSTPMIISYYGQTKAFTSTEIQNGTFDAWLTQVYSNHLTSPCATVLAQQTATTSTNLTTNVVQNIMNLTTIASVASINLDIGGNVNNGSAPKDSKKDEDDKNNKNNQTQNSGQNGQSTNQGSGENVSTTTGQQPNSTAGNSGNPVSPNPNQGGTPGNTNQGGTPATSTNPGSSQSNNPGSNPGSSTPANGTGNTGSSDPASGNANPGSANPSGNTGSSSAGNNSGASTGNNGGNGNAGGNNGGSQQGGSTGQGSETNKGENSGTTGSGNGQQQNSEQGNHGDEKIQGAKEEQNKVTSQQTAKTTSRARTTTQKPAILVTGDIVGLQQTRDTSNDARATVSYTRVKGDGSASLGVSADYMVNARISNVTLMRSWIKANDKGHKHINLVSGGLSVQPGAWSSTGMYIRVNSLKRFTAIYGAAGSYGYLFKEPMISTLAIGGFMYKGIMAKKIEATVIMAGVYSPYTKYYTETWWTNRPIVIPFFNLNYKVTKTFGMGITGGGTYLAGQNVLNYQVLLGAKLIL